MPIPQFKKPMIVIITARKRSCGKVMFLHLSEILFTHGVVSVKGGSLSVGLCLGNLCSVGSPSRGFSIQGVSVQVSLCPGGSLSRGSLSRGVLCPEGLSQGRSLSMGVSVKGVSVPECLSRGSLSKWGLCRERSLSRGFSPGGSQSRGSLSRGSSVLRGYAFQWNAFLYLSLFCFD